MQKHLHKKTESADTASIQRKTKNAAASNPSFDKNTETLAQAKRKEIVKNSSKISQLKSIQEMANSCFQQHAIVQKKENNTGLPNQLKSGVENLSGMSMDDVKVHYNSPKPAQLQAHAYAQGTDIHLASGQEKHLPHEAWHVVQQKQGRVKPTMQMKGKVNVNDDAGLEREADVMGDKAMQMVVAKSNEGSKSFGSPMHATIQKKLNLIAGKNKSIKKGNIVELTGYIYNRIKSLGFKGYKKTEVKAQITHLIQREGEDGDYDLTNQEHRELMHHEVLHLLKGKNLAAGKKTIEEIPAKNANSELGRKKNPFQITFLGGGASVAYYVANLGHSFNFSTASFIYKGQPWRSERGPGVVAHPEHMISPLRKFLGISMGNKGHEKMDQWMDRGQFSNLIEGVVKNAERKGRYFNKKVKKVIKKGALYKITLSDDTFIFSHRVVAGVGAGGHSLPKGLKPEDLHHGHGTQSKRLTPLKKLIMNMDVFTQIAGNLRRIDHKILESPKPVPKNKRGNITLVLSGGNAALDVAYDALAKGYKVKWITGSRGATFLPGFLNQAAALPHDKALDPNMPKEKQEALEKEIRLLYKDQHLKESGVSKTSKLKDVIQGRAGEITQNSRGVKAVVNTGNTTKNVTGNILVFAIGPDLSTKNIFSEDIFKKLEPIYDKDKRFTNDPYSTHLAQGSKDGSLEIIGGAAFRFVVVPFNENIQNAANAVVSLMNKYKSIKGKRSKRRKQAMNAPINHAVQTLQAELQNNGTLIQLENHNWGLATEIARKLTSSMSAVPKTLPGNVLISDQLTGILTQLEALNKVVPLDANFHSNFLIDDRTVLRIRLASALPKLKPATGDKVVKDIIKFRSAKSIGQSKLPAAVPPYQKVYQHAWEQVLAKATNKWTPNIFRQRFINYYSKGVKALQKE